MKISTLKHTLDVAPVGVEVGFDDLAVMLTTFRRHDGDKKSLPAWVPASFSGPRCKANVVDVSCFVLDVDDGTTLKEGEDLWPGFAKIVYTTWSYTAEKPKFRVVFPLAEPVPGDRWALAWAVMSLRARDVGINLDPKCCNQDRIYYLPALNPEQVHRSASVFQGELLDSGWRNIKVKKKRPRVYLKPDVGLDYLDPVDRLRVAQEAGFVIDENRAHHGICPACLDRSAWFFIEPDEMHIARCNHLHTCGWHGSIGALVAKVG